MLPCFPGEQLPMYSPPPNFLVAPDDGTQVLKYVNCDYSGSLRHCNYGVTYHFCELMLDQQVLGTSHNLGSGDFATEGFSKVVVSYLEMDTDLFQRDGYIHEISIKWRIFHILMFQILAGKKQIPRESCFFPLPEWVWQVIHVFILLSSHPIVGGLGSWGNSGKSPRLTNSWIG